MAKWKLLGISIASGALLSATTVGLVSAQSTSGTASSSGITRSTLRQDRLQAAASVLNISTDQVKTAIKDHNLKNLVQQAGLNRQTFRSEVRAKLVSELQAQGYSPEQISAALKHAKHHRHHH